MHWFSRDEHKLSYKPKQWTPEDSQRLLDRNVVPIMTAIIIKMIINSIKLKYTD